MAHADDGKDMFVSPGLAPDSLLAQLPPIRVAVGSFDPLLDDSVEFTRRCVTCLGLVLLFVLIFRVDFVVWVLTSSCTFTRRFRTVSCLCSSCFRRFVPSFSCPSRWFTVWWLVCCCHGAFVHDPGRADGGCSGMCNSTSVITRIDGSGSAVHVL
jgi:hypothetical protein